jgi:pimeloyl-ACP methyl ester carboxylesterase
MLFGFREGLFECCSPHSIGEPEFLTEDKRISSRSVANLFESTTGNLRLYFQRWQSDRHEYARAVVFCHHGEAEHSAWFNALAVRLTSIGCLTYALDAQGFGQSDGARGYFERFEDLVSDYVAFVKAKWAEVQGMNARSRAGSGHLPGLVLLGKGFGALVAIRALVELSPVMKSWGVTPALVLLSPAFQFTSMIGDRNDIACGLNRGQCGRQPAAQCARMPAAVALGPGADEPPDGKLEQMSHWFPKMIVTKPVDFVMDKINATRPTQF